MSYDVIGDLAGYLNRKLDVPVSSQVPKQRPAEFITIERTGGSSEIGTDRPGLSIQTWSTTEAKAYELALAARLVLLECWQELPMVIRVEVASIYNFPDPSSKQARYQIDVSMVTRL